MSLQTFGVLKHKVKVGECLTKTRLPSLTLNCHIETKSKSLACYIVGEIELIRIIVSLKVS
jgi:hypothetical protein